MVSRKADDDFDGKHGSIEPEAETRPGVYVQVSSTPRRRKTSNKTSTYESGDHAVEDTRGAHPPVRRGPGPMGMGTSSSSTVTPRVEIVTPRETTPRSQSQVREKESVPVQRDMRSEPTRARVAAEPARARGQIKEINQSFPDARAESENTNHRADIVRVSAPPGSMPPPRISVPSVLDAPQRLHSEPAPIARTPWGLITLVAIMSAIIAAAGAVALLEWRQSTRAPSQAAAPDPESPVQTGLPAASRYEAVKAKPAMKPVPEAAAVARPAAPPARSNPVAPGTENAAAQAVPSAPPPVELAPSADQASPQAVPEQAAAAAPGVGTETAVAPAPTSEPAPAPVAAAPVAPRIVAPAVAAPAPAVAPTPATPELDELPANPFEQNP